jgi:hypothetical protein
LLSTTSHQHARKHSCQLHIPPYIAPKRVNGDGQALPGTGVLVGAIVGAGGGEFDTAKRMVVEVQLYLLGSMKSDVFWKWQELMGV